MRRRQPEFPKAALVERRDITHDLMVMRFKTEEPLTFKPGQYCTLGLNGIERAYSIASAPHESEIEIFVELVPEPEGALTPLMWKMKLGDEMSIRPRCKGRFVLEEAYSFHLMVATVTGVAPFVSILRDYFHRGVHGHRFHVLEGASYYDEFVYDKELRGMQNQRPSVVSFLPTVSRPKDPKNKGWIGSVGRVNEIVEAYAEMVDLRPETTLVYACGHPGMIEDVKARMAPKGFKISEERFWKQ